MVILYLNIMISNSSNGALLYHFDTYIDYLDDNYMFCGNYNSDDVYDKLTKKHNFTLNVNLLEHGYNYDINLIKDEFILEIDNDVNSKLIKQCLKNYKHCLRMRQKILKIQHYISNNYKDKPKEKMEMFRLIKCLQEKYINHIDECYKVIGDELFKLGLDVSKI